MFPASLEDAAERVRRFRLKKIFDDSGIHGDTQKGAAEQSTETSSLLQNVAVSEYTQLSLNIIRI